MPWSSYADSAHCVEDFRFPERLEYARARLADSLAVAEFVSGIFGGWFDSERHYQTEVQCGEVITANTALTADLDCSASSGFVLKIEGDGITFDGRGHKIIAPNASAGIFVQGKADTVKNVRIDGITQGYGIFAYDSPGIQVLGNILMGDMIGIMIDAESLELKSALVTGNYSVGSSQFGVRTAQDGAGSIVNPSITINDFSLSGSFGMSIQAASYDLSHDTSLNVLTGSHDGIYLKTGAFNIHDISFKDYGAQNVQIFADTPSSVQVSNVDVSTTVPSNSEQEHVGIDLYRAAKFSISNLTAKYNDVGLKLETDSGVSPTGSVENSCFAKNTVAGIMIVSYDQTQYGVLSIANDTFNETPPALQILLENGTSVSKGSILGTTRY